MTGDLQAIFTSLCVIGCACLGTIGVIAFIVLRFTGRTIFALIGDLTGKTPSVEPIRPAPSFSPSFMAGAQSAQQDPFDHLLAQVQQPTPPQAPFGSQQAPFGSQQAQPPQRPYLSPPKPYVPPTTRGSVPPPPAFPPFSGAPSAQSPFPPDDNLRGRQMLRPRNEAGDIFDDSDDNDGLFNLVGF